MESPLESPSGPRPGESRPPPPPEWRLEELLAHAGWARGLARRLVHEAGLAEDVLQEAWLAALRRPPGALRHPRGWLATALNRAARQLGRGEGRRARRERAAARTEALPSAAELAETLDLQRRLAACVLALEPPYRDTLILRFYRDLTPLAIARAQGVPAGTVRSRLSRGLELLRARLDAEWGGDRRAWSLALARGLLRPLAPTAGPLVAIGLGALGLGLLAGLGWLATGGLARAPETAAAVATQAELTAPPANDTETGEEARLAGAPRRELASTEGATSVTREARAPEAAALLAPAYIGHVQAPDGSPIEGATLSLYPNKDWPSHPTPIGVGTSGTDGRFRIVSGPTDSTTITIGAEATGFQGLTMDPVVPESEIAITLAWTVVVAGTVRDAASQEPLGGVIVEFEKEQALSDEQGRYRLERVSTGRRVRIEARRLDHAPLVHELFLRANEPCSLDLELEAGLPLEVEVVDRETGRPLADVPIRAGPYHEPWTRTDARGRFPLRVLPGTETRCTIVGEGALWSSWTWMPPAEPPASVCWPVQTVAWIEGVVRDGEGHPLEGIALYPTSGAEPFLRFSLPEAERRASGAVGEIQHQIDSRLLESVTDGQGAFRVPVVPGDAPYRIHARSDGYVPREAGPYDVRSSAGKQGIELVLERGAVLRGRVLENGKPWMDDAVRWEHEDGRRGRCWITPMGYALPDLPPGTVRVWVEESPPGNRTFGEPVTLQLSAGQVLEHDFTWSVTLVPLTGRVLGTDGRPRGGIDVGATPLSPGASGDRTLTDEEGAFLLHVPPECEVRLLAWNEKVSAERLVAPGTEGLELVLPDAGILRLRLVEAGSGGPARVVDPKGLSVRRLSGEVVRVRDPQVDVQGLLEVPLEVGRYDLHLAYQHDGFLPLDLPSVEVLAEDAAAPAPPLRVELTRGVELELTLQEASPATGTPSVSSPRPDREHLLFLVEHRQEPSISGPFADQGPPANCRLNGIVMRVADPDLMAQWLQPDATGRARLRGLSPGTYALRAFPDDFVFEPAELELGAELRVSRVLRWRPR